MKVRVAASRARSLRRYCRDTGNRPSKVFGEYERLSHRAKARFMAMVRASNLAYKLARSREQG